MKLHEERFDDMRAELATLKRQHEQLRAAAVYACQGNPNDIRDVCGRRAVLRAALDASPAEPGHTIAGSRTTVVDGASVTEYELTSAAKQALTVDVTLPAAEPVRETFDPDAVRTLLRCVFNMSHASSQTILAAQTVRDSERK